MTTKIKLTSIAVFFSILFIGSAFSADGMKGHGGHDMSGKGKVGDLIHESMVDGYMLAYHFMDLRDKNKTDMDTPHHLMVYIMDEKHKPVLKGKVGFLIKDEDGTGQKLMGMYMSKGFGITADMKKKGVYTITTKAVLGDKKLIDRFNYEMK